LRLDQVEKLLTRSITMARALREDRCSVDPVAGMRLHSDLRFHPSAKPEMSRKNL
jgi:hypothetical protein